MLLFRQFSFLAAALLLSSAAAFGQVESTPIPQSPKPNFAPMAFLTGNWQCSIVSARRPRPYHTTSTARMSSDGYWLVTSTTTLPAPWTGRTLHGEDKMTYDASTSRWVDISTDDQGGYDISTSSGWSGNTITWNDITYPKTNATAVNYPTTVTKVSATKTTSKNTFKEPGGRVVSVTSTCTKKS